MSGKLTGLIDLILSLRTIVSGRAPAGGRTFSSISLPQLLDIMERKGLEVKLDLLGGLRVIEWKIGGLTSTVAVGSDNESVTFLFAVGGRMVTAEEHNRWNRDFRISRSFPDGDGDPVLAMDLDLAGGVCESRIVEFFDTCPIMVARWAKEILLA
jgi:hypothetical protein